MLAHKANLFGFPFTEALAVIDVGTLTSEVGLVLLAFFRKSIGLKDGEISVRLDGS